MSDGHSGHNQARCSRKVSHINTSSLGQFDPVHLQLSHDVIQDSAFLPINKPQEYIKQLWRSWSVDAEENGAVISLDRYLQGFIGKCQYVRASIIKTSEETFSSSDMSWLYLGSSPVNRLAWCPVMNSSPFAAFVPDGSQLPSKIELLDSGIVNCSSDSVVSAFSIPERLFFSNSRPVNTYFEATVVSLGSSISSLTIGFSEPKKLSNDSLSFQVRAACLISVTSSTITCNGVLVPNIPEEFQSTLKASAKQKGTVFGVHLDSTGVSTITFSVATFSNDASASLSTNLGSDAAASAGTAPSNALKPVPTKLLQHSVPWTFPDTFYPVVEIMQGSFHLNSGEVPFSLEVPNGASALLAEFPKNACLSPPVAALLTAYAGDKSSPRNCQQTVTGALVPALDHVLKQSDAAAIPASLSAQLSTSHALSKALADYEHEIAVLRNLLQDQEIFTALFRASHEDVLKEMISIIFHSFLAPDGLADPDLTSCVTPVVSTSTPREDSSSLTGPANAARCGVWGDVSRALSSMPQLEVAAVPSVNPPATPGTDDFAVRAASSLFDRSPPPSPRNLSPVPREMRSQSLPDAGITEDVFRSRFLACRSNFSAWLLEHFLVQATSALLGISDAQTASDSSVDSSVSAISIWHNVFANFVEDMSCIIQPLFSHSVPAKTLELFCIAMHCAGAVVAVKNASVSFLSCLLNFLESTFKHISGSDSPPSRSQLLLTRMPSYVLACAAQYSIDKNSNKQLDPSILQYLHSPIFDGGFLESFSKWKFLEDFGSRQSGISGTQKDHNAMSSFHEELANDTKSGSLWLSIFSQAVVHQGIQMNGEVINSKDDPIFKSEAFKAALSSFLHISGFVGFCCSVPDTPDYIKHPISNDTLKQMSPEIFVSWKSFFTDIADQFKSSDFQNILLSHSRLCLSLASPFAAIDGAALSGSSSSDLSPADSLLERRISGSSAQGSDKFVTELAKYLKSSIDDNILKSVAAERDLIIQSRSFGFQILRKLLELVQLVEDEFTLDFCRSMLCSVELCFAPIVSNERGSGHVVVGLSGTNRKSQQRMQSEWTQLMRCVLDTMHKVISEHSIGSSEALPLGFLLLNLFQQDSQWLNYGGNLISDILTIASGLNVSPKSLEAEKGCSNLRDSENFPMEGFAACAIADGEWLCHGGIILIDGVRTISDQFWFVQDGQCHAVTSDNHLHRAWHTLSMVQSNQFVVIGGASMMKSSGMLKKAKVAIIQVHFDRTSMSVKLTGVNVLGFRSPIMHSAVCVSDSPISPVILVVGGLGRFKTSAQLICINTPDTSFTDSHVATRKQRSGLTARRSSPPPSPSRPSIPCIAAPVSYSNKVLDVSPISIRNGFPFCFGCKPAVHRVIGSSQVIVSTIASEAGDSCILCLNCSNSSTWSAIPLEGWPLDRHCVVGSSFVQLRDGALLLVGGEDESSGDIATPIVISLRNFSCEVLFPIPEPLRFGLHHSFSPADTDKCHVLGNWRTVPHRQSCLHSSTFNLKMLRGSMRVRGLGSVLSGLCAQAILIPDKGFKIPVLSPLLWSLQGKRLHHAHDAIKIQRESIAPLPSSVIVLHKSSFSVCDSVIEFLEHGPQLIGFWFSMNSFSEFVGTILSIGGNGTSLCSLEIDSCRYLVMKSVSGVSCSPSSLPTNCWVHIAVSFLPAAIPQFCLYLNGYRLIRHDGWVSPMTSNLRSKDLGVAFGNKHSVLCVGHREGTDNTATISTVCLQKEFEFTSPCCFDVASVPPPSISRSNILERDIGSVLQSMRSVPTSTLCHVIQNDKSLVLVFLDLLFNGPVSLAGPCALILLSLISDFPSLYTPEFLDGLLPETFIQKLCDAIRNQSLNPGSFANRHHRNIYVHVLRELLHNPSFHHGVSNLLISQLTSIDFEKDVESNIVCCKHAISCMEVFSNRLFVFPGLDVLVSPSPSSPSTKCVVMRVSADCAAVHIKSASAQNYSCEVHPISHLQSAKNSKVEDTMLTLPLTLRSPFLNLVFRVLQARSQVQDSIAVSAFLDILLENSLQIISGSLASQSSIDLSSYSESLVSQLLDLSFESSSDSRMDQEVNSAMVDACLRLGWTVSKSATSMVINSTFDCNLDEQKGSSSSWMQVGSRPVVNSRHSTDSRFHSGVNLNPGTKFKVGLISSTAIRAICNSLKGNSLPQALLPNSHPYCRARFHISGEFFQPHPPGPVPVEDCLCFKLLNDGPRSIVSQNTCSGTEGLFCSFTLTSKQYTIVGLVPNTKLHMTNQQLEDQPVFYSPIIGQASGDQFKAVVLNGQELTGWKEGLTVTIIADPFASVVAAFVDDTLVGAFRCECQNMRFCIS